MDNQSKSMLEEVYKGIHMGEQALIEYNQKLTSPEIKKAFQDFISEYENLKNRAEDIYDENQQEIPKNSMMADAGVWGNVQINTIMDTTNSHVVEKVIEGINKGNLELVKLMNKYVDADDKIRRLAQDVIDDGEKFAHAFEEYVIKH